MTSVKPCSYSGFAIDEVKSALQKAIRRGKIWECLQWTVEMFEVDTDDTNRVTSTRTNLFNRLLVISIEDISPTSAEAILLVWNLIRNNRNNVLAYMTAALYLCNCKKSRVNDWACHYYEDTQPSDMQPIDIANNLKINLTNKNILQSLWCFEILTRCKVNISGYKYRKSLYLFWVVLNDLFPDNIYIKYLQEIALTENWRWQHKSHLIYCHLIHLICQNMLPNNNTTMKWCTNIIINSELNKYLDTIKSKKYLVPIPDYAIDKHTTKGRNMGRDSQFFLDNGAVLTNIDYIWQEWSDFYLNKFKHLKNLK